MIQQKQAVDSAPAQYRRNLNVPNALCVLRLCAAAGMIAAALGGHVGLFLSLFLAALLSDWLDGKLAMLLNQRTDFGARLDSVADAAMYLALLFGAFWLRSDVVYLELPWIAAALVSHFASLGVAQYKFRRWPSYHTWAAKIAWWLVAVGAFIALGGWLEWPFRVAMLAVVLANLEAIAITCILKEWAADVRSIHHARKQ